MAGYRVDQRTRCTRCEVVVPAEDLFHTVGGEALCVSCKAPWADEQARAVWEGGESKQRPGFRLVCPHCDLATMSVRESDFARAGRCLRCGKKTRQLRGGVFLAAALAMMGAVALDVAMSARFLVLGTVVLGVLALVLRDQFQRRRHRVATLDEIEQADLALKADRQRVAVDALRVSDPLLDSAAEQEAHAVEQAQAEASERGRAG